MGKLSEESKSAKEKTNYSPVQTETKENDTVPENTSDKESSDVAAAARDKGGVPLDRGWAWFVLLGAFLETFIVVGLAKSSGILFVAIQDHFKSSSSVTSLLSTVQNATYSISALMVMTVLTRRFTTRSLLIFGSSLTCIALVISSQLTDIRLLIVSHGVMQGMGTAFMQPTSLMMVGQYFSKRRAFANSIAVSGGSLGGLVLAPLITVLLEQYRYQGCILILGGLMLNGCISGALFRPPSFYSKPKPNSNESSTGNITKIENKNLNLNKNGTLQKHALFNGTQNGHGVHVHKNGVSGLPKQSPRPYANGIDPVLLGSEPLIPRIQKGFRKRTLTESCDSNDVRKSAINKHLTMSREYIAGSYMDIPGFDDIQSDKDTISAAEDGDKKKKKTSCLSYLTKLFDFKLFKDPVFVLMELSFGMCCSGCALTPVFIAPYAREVGVDASGVATIVTIFSAIDLCSRIGIGVIADLNFLRRSNIIGICIFIVAMASFMLKFYTSYAMLVFYAVMLGLFGGGYFSLFAVVIVDYMTLAKLHSCIGFATLFHGAFVAVGFITVGALRDSTGSYVASFYYLGTCMLVGAVIMISIPYVEKLRDRKTEKEIIV